jgi:hypothetical protein
MPVNETLGILAQIVIRIEGSLRTSRAVLGPAFRRVEGDDAERVAVPGGQEMRMMVSQSVSAGSASS